MHELMIFNNEEFGQIRTVEIDGEIYFVGKDVTEISATQIHVKRLLTM